MIESTATSRFSGRIFAKRQDSRKALERRNAWAPRFVTAVPSRSKLWPHAPVATSGGYDSSSGPVQCPVATMFAYIEGKIQKEALYLQVTSMDGTKGKSGGVAA